MFKAIEKYLTGPDIFEKLAEDFVGDTPSEILAHQAKKQEEKEKNAEILTTGQTFKIVLTTLAVLLLSRQLVFFLPNYERVIFSEEQSKKIFSSIKWICMATMISHAIACFFVPRLSRIGRFTTFAIGAQSFCGTSQILGKHLDFGIGKAVSYTIFIQCGLAILYCLDEKRFAKRGARSSLIVMHMVAGAALLDLLFTWKSGRV